MLSMGPEARRQGSSRAPGTVSGAACQGDRLRPSGGAEDRRRSSGRGNGPGGRLTAIGPAPALLASYMAIYGDMPLYGPRRAQEQRYGITIYRYHRRPKNRTRAALARQTVNRRPGSAVFLSLLYFSFFLSYIAIYKYISRIDISYRDI